MSKSLRVPRVWVVVCAVAAATAAFAVPASSASAASNTICALTGLPSTTTTIPIDGIAHVTLTTCDAAVVPPFPTNCVTTIDVPGVLHVRVFVCLPGQQAGANSSTSGTTMGLGGLVAGSIGPGAG